ncbi:MAG: hypothetical protein ABI729_01420, partial [Chitinophagales bacterium]
MFEIAFTFKSCSNTNPIQKDFLSRYLRKTEISKCLSIVFLLNKNPLSNLFFSNRLLIACMVVFEVVPQFLSASHVTGLNGFYRNGQVFLTWINQSNQNNYYKVYRSQSPITQGWQLSGCEYLGWTVQKSALDFDLTAHYNQSNYLCIDSGGTPLPSTKGLMVATTLANGSYYYAVTVKTNNSEDTTI